MTIGAVRRNDYTGNGTTATYTYGFKVFLETALTVTVRNATTNIETTLTLTTHYTVTGVGAEAGGTIVLVTGFDWMDGSNFLDSGQELAITRNMTFSQATDVKNQGSFQQEIHEDAFDFMTMLSQQIQDQLDRSMHVPVSFPPATYTLEMPAPSADMLLGWSADALSIVNKADLSAYTISTFAETLLDDTTAAAMRTTLGSVLISSDIVGIQDKWLPAGLWAPRTTNGPSGPTDLELSTNDIMIQTLDFSNTTSEAAHLMMMFQKRWDLLTITFEPYWTAASSSGTVFWDLAGRAYANSDPLDTAPGTLQQSQDTLLTIGDAHIGPESSAITLAGTPAAHQLVVLEISRDIADTLAADAKLIGIMLHITSNALNDD